METDKRQSPICVYDWTAPADYISKEEIIILLKEHCKKWAFQKEQGEKTGYIHWQGRLSLKEKLRLNQLIKTWGHPKFSFKPTSDANKDNVFYVIKNETRIEGPWTDKDPEEQYVPRQIREIETLYPWQERVIKISKIWDTRKINCIVDGRGNNGKSTLVGYMRAHNLGRKLPFSNDYRDLMRMVMDMPTSNCYIIDMPRAINKEKLFQLWSAIEEIKGGYAYDDRYSFKEKLFDCPQIFVFMNSYPDTTLLSKDRWKMWYIDENMRLKPYEKKEEIEGGEGI